MTGAASTTLNAKVNSPDQREPNPHRNTTSYGSTVSQVEQEPQNSAVLANGTNPIGNLNENIKTDDSKACDDGDSVAESDLNGISSPLPNDGGDSLKQEKRRFRTIQRVVSPE